MNDQAVKLSLQDAAREIARRFPDRGFALFIFKSDDSEQTHYVSNGDRRLVMKVMGELRDSGLPGIPGNPSHS